MPLLAQLVLRSPLGLSQNQPFSRSREEPALLRMNRACITQHRFLFLAFPSGDGHPRHPRV